MKRKGKKEERENSHGRSQEQHDRAASLSISKFSFMLDIKRESSTNPFFGNQFNAFLLVECDDMKGEGSVPTVKTHQPLRNIFTLRLGSTDLVLGEQDGGRKLRLLLNGVLSGHIIDASHIHIAVALQGTLQVHCAAFTFIKSKQIQSPLLIALLLHQDQLLHFLLLSCLEENGDEATNGATYLTQRRNSNQALQAILYLTPHSHFSKALRRQSRHNFTHSVWPQTFTISFRDGFLYLVVLHLGHPWSSMSVCATQSTNLKSNVNN
ncbi:hypothetical protein EYF80_005553 [Liparis tanakae]|uniref:Uncharacterized protein n=1 Tax=Liparis tanakae TaxID=230148 RepID=A0A4Z2J216_9TELE|nr:hypothetical protein EYF80_005553 [Liparis tanakae]